MASVQTTKDTILRVIVDNNKAIAQIAEWNELIDEQKEKQQQLKKARKDGTMSEQDYQKAMAASRNEVAAYNKQMAALNKEVQNSVKIDSEKADSLAGLRAELSNATKEYDSLSAAERNAAQGQALQQHINDVTKQLKNAEEGTGRFYRNVGNYTNSITQAFQGMGGAAGAAINPIKKVTMGFQTLSKTPVIAILGLLANIIAAVIKALKSSEDNINAVTVSFSALSGVGTIVTKIMQKLGGVVAKAAEWLGKAADKLGLITDTMKTEQQLTRDQIALSKVERQNRMKNADDELKIAKLKVQAADKTKYSAKERLAFLQQAADLEEGISKRNLDTAKEQYRILQEKSKLADNSAQENDELASAYEKMRQAETSYFNKTKELTGQMVTARQELLGAAKAEAKATVKAESDKTKATKEAVKTEKELMLERAEMRSKEIAEELKTVEQGTQREYQLRRDQMELETELEIQKLSQMDGTNELIRLKRETLLQSLRELDQEYEDALVADIMDTTEKMLDQWQAEHDKEKELAQARKDMQLDAAGAIAGALGTTSRALSDLGDSNSALTKLSKVLGLAQIAIDTGVATAEGIKSAMGAPFPANLAAVATTIATVVSGMASAIASVKSAKFATGGIVTGPGTATSDSIPARLSNGESVMNARSTSMFAPVLSALNQAGGGAAFSGLKGSDSGFDFMASAIAAGMQSADIYVSVEAIDRVSANTNRVKALATH